MSWKLFSRTINKVGVVGSGNIGPDIALYFSKVLHRHQVPVVVVDIAEKALKSGEARVKAKIGRGVKSGAFRPDEAEAMTTNITWTTDYSKLEGVDLVIEAATEDKTVKGKIFSELEKVCPSEAILASNSSHLEPEVIFAEAKHKERCLVIHYFFPAERSIIVEIVPSQETKPEIVEFLMHLYEQIGKAPIKVKSRYGYAVDPIFEGLFLAAALLVEKGVATVKQIDAMAQRALGLGIGPFTAMNLTGGNPITQHGLSKMHDKIMPWFHCPKILDDQIASGKLWDTPQRGEEVSYAEGVFEAVANQLRGAFFGLVCEIIDSGISNIADLEMAVENALVMDPPFQTMNKMGIEKALALVEAYAKEWPDFKIPEVLKEQSKSGKPWLAEIKRDNSIKGAVLTGFGLKAFVSGADINEILKCRTPQQMENLSLKGQEALNLIENLGKPVVCALNGLAYGGGNELAMACTARIAPKGIKALVAQPEPKLGIIPGFGGSQRLPRLVGLAEAWPILRSGNPISSAEALRIGLIQQEIEGDIKEEGIALVKKIISGQVKVPPVRKEPLQIPESLPEVDIGHLSRKIDELLKKAVLEGAAMTLAEGLQHEARVLGECVKTKDMRIGMENFMKYGPKKNAFFCHA